MMRDATEFHALLRHPLLRPWGGSFGGVPPFDKIDAAVFNDLFDEAVTQAKAEIDAIAQSKDAPSFDNSYGALERVGGPLRRLGTLFYVCDSALATPEFQAIAGDIYAKLAKYDDEVVQNHALFLRLEAVYLMREALLPEERRLVEETYDTYVRSGAKLDEGAKARVAAINQRLALLFDHFNQAVLKDEQKTIEFAHEDVVDLPEGFRKSIRVEKDGLDTFVLKNSRSLIEPFLSLSSRRDLREKAWHMFTSRGRASTPSIIVEILALRSERAAILGFESHAHWRLKNSMAKTPEAALKLMKTVWSKACARALEEISDNEALLQKDGIDGPLKPWDYRYYAEKVRKSRYDLDEAALRPYLSLDNMVEAMFYMAKRLYDLSFVKREDIATYHLDVRVYEVTKSGKTIGLWYFDPYAREGKRSGAWMSAYRSQSNQDGHFVLPLVSNNANLMKPALGEATLLSWDDAVTLFHEFGHGLHGLCSDVTFDSLSGTNTVRDFVEFPSQLHEKWLSQPDILHQFARHYQTGETMPHDLIEKINQSVNFLQGFKTVEFLASAYLDMALHLPLKNPVTDPIGFETEQLNELGIPAAIVPRHGLCHFSHIFSSDGYSAGYYAYLWADVLTHDGFEAFLEAGSVWDKSVAKRLYDHVLSQGNRTDPALAYRAFRGRDPDPLALMRARGF